MKAEELKAELDRLYVPKAGEQTARFFKSYEGGYSAHDKFLGIRVPVIRAACKNYKDLSLSELEKLLASPIHEHRFAGLVIITNRAKKADQAGKKLLYDFYMAHLDGVNNWDLVDISCPTVVGNYLSDKGRAPLYKLAGSQDLWHKRIAMVSTLGLIRERQLDDTFAIAKILIKDEHDLIHKAVGWMLRCAGDVDKQALLKFLDAHAHKLRRTALRYSLEHLTPAQKKTYMSQRTENT